jgi:hypothetical protein
MDIEQALNRIISLAMKSQDPAHWRIMAGCESDIRHHEEQAIIDRQMSRAPGPFDAALFRDSARQNQEAAEIHRSDLLTMRGELIELQNLVRIHAPTLLEMTVTAADVSGEINVTQTDKLKRLEGAVRAMLDLTGGDDDERKNPWKQARDADSKITIADQMMLLFKRDDSIVDRKNLSAEVAKILGCSSQAVRHAENASWKYYQAEQARRKELRQALKGKNSSQYRNGQRLAKSDDEDNDD